MALKPWHKVMDLREDLQLGKSLTTDVFAVHLDHVKDGTAPEDYINPERFFDQTYLTKNLKAFAVEVQKRLSGIKKETNAIFNLSTQFGGGKTHALTLLLHLARLGNEAKKYNVVGKIISEAGLDDIPTANVATFVGTEFDVLSGRGKENEPVRLTPWGDIAWQLKGAEGFELVSHHDSERVAPSAEQFRKLLDPEKPTLILMDEVMSYVSGARAAKYVDQFYKFLHILSEEARNQSNVVLAVSIPKSEVEMTEEDLRDFDRMKKLLDRLGKPLILSSEGETTEIIRRRLFKWIGGQLPKEANDVVNEYSDWIRSHKGQIPGWFSSDHARDVFEQCYPFHPSVISVFDRKWQSLERFQRTRGILRLLAHWVSYIFMENQAQGRKDPLITLGSAPLEDPNFRAAMFEQLGTEKLEVPIMTDITGKKAIADQLDKEAVDSIRQNRLHRQVACAVFFESNGGQTKEDCSEGEVRLAVGRPGVELGNIETVLDTLVDNCHYLTRQGKNLKFSQHPNLNRIILDKESSVDGPRIKDRVREEIQKVFKGGPRQGRIERKFFPDKTSDVPDRAELTLVVLDPQDSMASKEHTLKKMDELISQCGQSNRTYKNAVIFAVPEAEHDLEAAARKLLAWEDLDAEKGRLQLDSEQISQIPAKARKYQNELKEQVWRSYNRLYYLSRNNGLVENSLGQLNSSSEDSIVDKYVLDLSNQDQITSKLSPRRVVSNWAPAFPKEWSTEALKEAVYASPQFERILSPSSLQETIADGVREGTIAYVGMEPDGTYSPFYYDEIVSSDQIEILDETYIIRKAHAVEYVQYLKNKVGDPDTPPPSPQPPSPGEPGGQPDTPGADGGEEPAGSPDTPGLSSVSWQGVIPPQKWNQFYMKVLSKFATDPSLAISLSMKVSPSSGIPQYTVDELRTSLRELGLDDNLITDDD